jgi:hypothetical protein
MEAQMRRWLARLLLALGVGGLISLVFLYQDVVRPHPANAPPSYPFAEAQRLAQEAAQQSSSPIGESSATELRQVPLSPPAIIYWCDTLRLALIEPQPHTLRTLLEEVGHIEYLALSAPTPYAIGVVYRDQRWTAGYSNSILNDSSMRTFADIQQQQGATPDGRRRVDLVSCFEQKSSLGEAVLGLVEDSDGRPQIIPIAVRGPFFGQLAGREGQALPAEQVLPIMRDFARAQLAERASNPTSAQIRMLCALPLGAVLVAAGLVLRRLLRRRP